MFATFYMEVNSMLSSTVLAVTVGDFCMCVLGEVYLVYENRIWRESPQS